jgi:hypothetical protein
MDDVLTGFLFLLLPGLATLLGLVMRSRSRAICLKPFAACRTTIAPADASMNRWRHPIGQWLVRVARATCAPSSEDAGAAGMPVDPPVVRQAPGLVRAR